MKSASTNDVYQSRILPIFQKAETKIKTLVLLAFLLGQTKFALLVSIIEVIKSVGSKLPADFSDKDAYVNGLLARSDYYIKEYYNKPQISYSRARDTLIKTAPADRVLPELNTPKKVYDFVSNPKNLWAEAKGSPNVVDYPKELKRTIAKLSESPMTVQEPGKRPISIWQKAELETRYENQMQNLQNLRVKGEDLCWISSHVNCSKRCQPWQGKLVSLSQHGDSSFKVGVVDGHTVYSLPDIMAQVDKYGYHNNIICGFNCRHRLIPYRKGTVAPKEYKKGEVAKQRTIEAQIREMERQIRFLKTQEHLYNKSGMVVDAKAAHSKWKKLESQYKKFCETNGYAWQEYRIKIM